MSVVAAMVAVAIVSIAVVAMTRAFANLMEVQKVARLQGQEQDIRTLLRGSVSCDTHCPDVLADIPKHVSGWDMRSSCKSGIPFVEMHNPKLGPNWLPVFKPGFEAAICSKRIERLAGARPPRDDGKKSRRVVCPQGQELVSIDFENETIACR